MEPIPEEAGQEQGRQAPELRGWSAWYDPQMPLRLGVSSCLLGESVRYDGGHCRDRFVVDTLGSMVDWVSVCPEMGIGMPAPRPTIRLEQEGAGLRLVAPSTGSDHTEAMAKYAQSKMTAIDVPNLDGYVVKKNSPSCGLERLPIYKNGKKAGREGVGMFTQALLQRYPDLPVEEDGRINDARLRESFIGRIFGRNRWRGFLKKGGRNIAESGGTGSKEPNGKAPDRKSLVDFHTAHKLLIRAHDENTYQELGRLVASFGQQPDAQIFERYGELFLHGISKRVSVKRHCNVLQHVMGYFKDRLSPADKQHLLSSIEDYRVGHVPLVVPLSLLRFNAEQHQIEYLLGQIYFDPYPKQWMLRNFT